MGCICFQEDPDTNLKLDELRWQAKMPVRKTFALRCSSLFSGTCTILSKTASFYSWIEFLTMRFRNFKKCHSRSKNQGKKESSIYIRAVLHQMLRIAEFEVSES